MSLALDYNLEGRNFVLLMFSSVLITIMIGQLVNITE